MSTVADVATRSDQAFPSFHAVMAFLRWHHARLLIRISGFLIALLVAGTVLAADPFDSARYAIGIKDNATALRLIDSGQFDINMQNHEGYTLLNFAAGDGNLSMVDALLDRGADPTIKTLSGHTPLERAIGTMVAVRLKQAMDARMTAGGITGALPPRAGTADFDKIRMAIGSRYDAVAIAELDKGIDINMQNIEGYTLLHFASLEGNLVMVEELLRRGANPDIRINSGQTALDVAMGTMVRARLMTASGGKGGITANVAKPARPVQAKKPAPAAPVATPVPAKKAPTSTSEQSPHAKMCASRHYSSAALCSDSTCKMREYRKWQTCLKTGSYY